MNHKRIDSERLNEIKLHSTLLYSIHFIVRRNSISLRLPYHLKLEFFLKKFDDEDFLIKFDLSKA